jgi:hypothetical protein
MYVILLSQKDGRQKNDVLRAETESIVHTCTQQYRSGFFIIYKELHNPTKKLVRQIYLMERLQKTTYAHTHTHTLSEEHTRDTWYAFLHPAVQCSPPSIIS